MQNQKSISNASDPWLQAQATESLIRAYRSPNGDVSLRDYVPKQRPPDPAPVVTVGTPNVPENDPNFQFERMRLTTITRPDGRVIENPYQVSATPVEQKPTPRQVPTVKQVTEELESLKRTVSVAEDQFEADKASRPAIHARMTAIGSELGPLVERVRALEAELNELKSIPAPEAAFTAAVAAHELAVQTAAGHTLECLQQNWAQHIFGIPSLQLQLTRSTLLASRH